MFFSNTLFFFLKHFHTTTGWYKVLYNTTKIKTNKKQQNIKTQHNNTIDMAR